MIGLSGGFSAMLGIHCPEAVGLAISGNHPRLLPQQEAIDLSSLSKLNRVTFLLR